MKTNRKSGSRKTVQVEKTNGKANSRSKSSAVLPSRLSDDEVFHNRRQNVGTKANNNKSAQTKVSTLMKADWNYFLGSPSPFKERLARGKAMRNECSRSSHAEWKAPPGRRDPLALLASQDPMRITSLLPLRYGRMMASPFSFYRGAALVMASDLAYTAQTNLIAQLCGDCHLSNFGVFATPERNIIFDLNDFDETLPGPIEWDIKRLATSFVVAAKNSKFSDSVAERCVRALSSTYRRKMEEFSQQSTLDIWYDHVNFERLSSLIAQPGRKQTVLGKLKKLKDKRNHMTAVQKLTEIKDGKRRIRDNPPLILHPEVASAQKALTAFKNYSSSLWESRQRLLQRYHFVDAALKVVGVGSVGMGAFILLLQGDGNEEDYIFLQLKEVFPSVLEQFLGRSQFDHSGQRVVNGQRLLQASSDLFLGWTTGDMGRELYVRQLMDGKASVPVEDLDASTLEQYAEACAYVLARAHARSGDPILIHGYLGKSESFDDALVKFAFAYARQNERDFQALLDAVNRGKIIATPGI